jgi:hypothetical protein
MPRDVNGNYTLAAGNPVVTDTVIQASWANNTLDDLALAMTDSLLRTGLGGINGQFLLDETQGVINPALAFISEPTSGFYRSAPNILGFSILSTEVLLISGTEITADIPIILSTSTPSVPLEATSKGYVDAEITILDDEITILEGQIAALESQIGDTAFATGSHSFGPVSSGTASATWKWAHGLGTDDVDFGFSINGSLLSSDIIGQAEAFGGYSISIVGAAVTGTDGSSPDNPGTGEISFKVYVDNITQSVDIKVWARTR